MSPSQPQSNLNPFSSEPPLFAQQTPLKNKSSKTIQDKLRDFVQKHRTISIIIIIVTTTLLLTGLILLIKSKLPVQIEQESAPSTYFNHRYLLEYSIGRSNATQVFFDLNSIILNPESISSAPQPNQGTTYACTLAESSYKKLSSPKNTYQINLDVSDGRTYTLTVRLSPDDYGYSYMVTIADRTDSDTAADYVFINTDNFNQYSSELNAWIDSFNLNSPIVTVSPNTAEDID